MWRYGLPWVWLCFMACMSVRKRYPSDLTDERWALAIEEELPVAGEKWPWGDPHGYPYRPLPVGGDGQIFLRGVQKVTVPERLPNVLGRAIRVALAERATTAIIIPSDVQELEYSPHTHAFKMVPSSLGVD
jgi:hypothetical protein